MSNSEWTVVGVFESGHGDAHEAEAFADADTLMAAYQRTTSSSVVLKLTNAAAFPALRATLSKDSSLSVSISQESVYYQQRSQTFARVLALIANLIGAIMAVGAVFAALNSMYSVVSARCVGLGSAL